MQNEKRETGLAFLIADRIISIQECDEGYDYSIMNQQYREIDGGIYDNLDISIREALQDIIDDLKQNPDTNGAKGMITEEAELIPMDFDEVVMEAEEANRIGSAVYDSKVVMEFKAKTEACFHPINELDSYSEKGLNKHMEKLCVLLQENKNDSLIERFLLFYASEIDKAVQDKNDELLKEIWNDLFTLRDFVWYKAKEQLKD